MVPLRTSIKSAALGLAVMVGATACGTEMPTAVPVSTGPNRVLVDYDIPDTPANVTITPGLFKVCKVGPPGTTFSFQTRERRHVNGVEVIETKIVTVEAGKCKVVDQNEPDPWVMVTELPAPGFVLDSIRVRTQAEVKADATTSYHVVTDSYLVVGSNSTDEEPIGLADTNFYPRYRAAGAVAIFYNSVATTPGLEVKKSALASPVNAGTNAGFQIVVNSTGTAPVTSVTVTDSLPVIAGGSWSISQQPGVGSCAITAGTLNCTIGTLAPGASVTVKVTHPTTTNSCGTYTNTVTVTGSGLTRTDNASVTVNCPPPPTPAKQGCTPGYWKQSQHFDSYVGYKPSQQFSSVFENAFPGKTLVQVLGLGGAGLNALGRHAVAALLNASNSSVDYGMTPQQVIDAFNAVFPGGNYEALKNQFEVRNEKGCPLN
jgi:hypothetical protein